MTTSTIITKALNILNGFDFHWRYDDGYGICARARFTMREFVNLAAQCECNICNALRDLWIATFEFNKGRMTAEAFTTKRSELMAIILPTSVSLAA